MTNIKKRLISIKNTIYLAQSSSAKQGDSVTLLAVSKTWSAENIHQANQAGQRHFGENYLQEALKKITLLQDLDIEWHFIGPIQSNKTKEIAAHFDWVQSLDRAKIAQRLAKQRPENKPDLNICIQVNIDDESSKSGITPSELFSFAHQISQINGLVLRGLMIIPTKTGHEEQQRIAFKKAYSLFEQLANQYPTVDTLSMGMSADMILAIEEGSTMVRIGTALFGQRAKPINNNTKLSELNNE
ncbi:MAG: YggS family pyridoxal phosphate-dependent enzyme [Methylophaga sp.]|nr:MAG: YggS family pyridoxal phosphate-dependent enzyme [Methylophaga sp.]